jgi:hypothetical protein
VPITVHIHSNNGFVIEIPDGSEEPLRGNNQQLSHKEFKAALEEFDALVKKLAKPDDQPLSDYAMSRESIYEDHPKL